MIVVLRDSCGNERVRRTSNLAKEQHTDAAEDRLVPVELIEALADYSC